MNIYVGNLNWSTTEDELRELFAAHGEVSSVSIIKDKFSGRSRGFAFVEMPSDEQGQSAIDALNETEVGGRALKVSVARPRESRNRGQGRDREKRRW